MPSKAKTVSKKTTAKKTKLVTKKQTAPKIEAQVFDIQGRAQGKAVLPKEIFGQKPNEKLMIQAVRVYLANRSHHKASTKTRAEVKGGGAKPWRQKGTGRARAGSIRSPLWVGGGVAFGPKPKNTKLKLSKKMKKIALASALSFKNNDGSVKIISNLEKLPPKTKQAKSLLDKLEIRGKTLIILEDSKPNVKLATRNIPGLSVDLMTNLNAYEVLAHHNLLISKRAIENIK